MLESSELFWVSTVRTDGRPHVTPLVAVWSDDALYFSVGANEQKAVNLRSNDNVVLATGRNSWDQGLDVIVEGRSERVTATDELTRANEAWTHKWDGRWNYAIGDGCFHHQDGEQVFDEPILVFRVVPKKVLAFAKGAFSHTTHRF